MTLNQNYKLAKFGPRTEICSNFYGIWHSQQLERANYEYNGYRVRTIIGCKI